ncbi:MAG: site-specific DNA-methyltransferase [Methylobacter sp.]
MNTSANIEHLDTGILIPYARNSRTHSPDQVRQIAASIREFGFTNPVLIAADNGIIAGHGRVMAAQQLGLSFVPCLRLAHLTEAQKRAYIIADNKLALNAGWDEAMLKIEFQELRELDYDLELTGFSLDELDDFLEEEDQKPAGAADQVPDIQTVVITQPSDVWLLGEHRLMCGSSTGKNDVLKLLNGQSPNTMITDPPYGVKYEANWRAKAKKRQATEREISSNLKNDDQADWFNAYSLFPGTVAYVWHASTFTDIVMDGLRRAGFEIKQQIIWNKNVHVLSRSDYHWKHEPCWYAVRPGGDRNWQGGRTQMTVWDIKSIIFEGDKTAHPTQKPVEIYTRGLEHHTNAGEYVYEPFGGSGTSIIACEKLRRRSLTMELDPKYCDVIVRRWQNYAGKAAVRESDGKTFDQLAAIAG